jgi:hypothetical protein
MKLDEFYRIHDFAQPIAGILLTPKTRNLGQIDVEKGEFREWRQIIREEGTPSGFPLKNSFRIPPNENEYTIIVDRPRW